MKIAIFGPTGMLGSNVYRVLQKGYELVLVGRDHDKLDALEAAYGDVGKHKSVHLDLAQVFEDWKTNKHVTFEPVIEAIGDVDGVVNCIGLIKPYAEKSMEAVPLTFFINGVFPHLLSQAYGPKLIQITTDCVYSGVDGRAPYTEQDGANPTDIYGISKSHGEPWLSSLVLRTSIIGKEVAGYVSLVEWVKKQEGQTIKGFSNHLWNGITARQFGKIVDEIVSHRGDYPQNGRYHIFSEDVTKLDMLKKIAEHYKINVTIEDNPEPKLDRRLGTVEDLNSLLKIPSFQDMINELE